MAALICLTVTLLAGVSHGYQTFQNLIPNGNNVPHPCKVNFMWPGVGHENRLGGGARNSFGTDFKQAGYQWSSELCNADSDGDGRTNGEELGDPKCQWARLGIPERTSNITNPGICDPYGSPQCLGRNDFVDCEMEEFFCPAVKEPNITKFEMTFRKTKVPATETNYYCMTFDLPQDQDYHVIATEPIIDNADVLHHILVFACEDDNATIIDPPQSCGMSAEGECGTIIGLWAVGGPGFCYGSDIGYRIGASSYKRVKVEIHYNNPFLVDNHYDASGISLYLQPARPEVQDLVTFTVGANMHFTIPPGQSRIEIEGRCKGTCTAQMVSKPAKIMAATNHMHYMGQSMSVQLYRRGRWVANITSEDFYSYDSPVIFKHTPAIDLLPGDEIVTKCVYNSMNKDSYTFFGDATSDEMCYGFLFVYPKEAIRFRGCTSVGPLDVCDMFAGTPINTPVGQCKWGEFTYTEDGYTPEWMKIAKSYCLENGYCTPRCKAAVEQLLEVPCMQKEVETVINWRLARSKAGRAALARINGCRGAIWSEKMSSNCSTGGHTDGHTDGHDSGYTWEQCLDFCPSTGGYSGASSPVSNVAAMLALVLLVFVKKM